MFILSDVKDTILSARNSDEGTPNRSIGLVFTTDPEDNAIASSITTIYVRDGNGPADDVNAIAESILAERLGDNTERIFTGIRDFMTTQVRGGILMAVYVAYGVNDLSMSYIGNDGDVLAEGYGVDLFYADQATVNFVGQPDGIVPMIISSAGLPVPFIEDAPRESDSVVQVALARLFDALTATQAEIQI